MRKDYAATLFRHTCLEFNGEIKWMIETERTGDVVDRNVDQLVGDKSL